MPCTTTGNETFVLNWDTNRQLTLMKNCLQTFLHVTLWNAVDSILSMLDCVTSFVVWPHMLILRGIKRLIVKNSKTENHCHLIGIPLPRKQPITVPCWAVRKQPDREWAYYVACYQQRVYCIMLAGRRTAATVINYARYISLSAAYRPDGKPTVSDEQCLIRLLLDKKTLTKPCFCCRQTNHYIRATNKLKFPSHYPIVTGHAQRSCASSAEGLFRFTDVNEKGQSAIVCWWYKSDSDMNYCDIDLCKGEGLTRISRRA